MNILTEPEFSSYSVEVYKNGLKSLEMVDGGFFVIYKKCSLKLLNLQSGTVIPNEKFKVNI